MRMRVLFCCAMLVYGGVSFGQGIKPVTQPTLNTNSLNRWNLLNQYLIQQPPVVALEAKSTTYKVAGFPENMNSRALYSAPAGPVVFRACFNNLLKTRFQLAIQYASSPASFHGIAPYAGWEKPFGLLETTYLDANTQNNTQGGIAYPVQPWVQGDLIAASQRATEFTQTLPSPKFGAKGSQFFVRVVPFEVQNGKRVAIGPSSNWVRFFIEGTPQEQANAAEQQKIAAAKAKAEAEGKLLVTKAAEAQKALRDNYEIRLLSYIPPKFSDDQGAENYFIAHSPVSFTYDKTKATNMGAGETYSVSYIRNLLKSNQTWNQELWEVTSAALNQQNGFLQAAKMGLVNGLCAGIEASTGVKVGADVRAAMLMGVNFALAYCGIPPSLPNIDQLYDRGIDYLAATIADYALEQATGVAMDDFGANPMMTMAARDAVRERAKTETKALIEKLTKPAPFKMEVPETWGTPAPFFRRRPPMVYLEIRLRPGRKPVTGQTWQALDLKFQNNNVFANASQVALPRSVNQKVRVPIALGTTLGPQSWKIAGFMPRPGVDPAMQVGQPYYQGVGSAKLLVTTHHRLVGTGQMFGVYHTAFDLNPNLVNAIPLPEKAFFLPGEQDKALDAGKITLGAGNYVGRTSYRPFSVP